MGRIRISLGATAALLLVLAGCAQEDAAPEVGPAAESSAISPDDPGDGAGNEEGEERGGGSGDGGDGGDGGDVASEPLGPGPDDPADEAPAVSLPRLPIGGDADPSEDPAHPDVQCADVSWLGERGTPADLTPGLRVLVTGVKFSSNVHTLTAQGCASDLPACTGFVYHGGARQCSVAVAVVPGAVDQGESYFFTLTGTADCAAVGEERCKAFEEAVRVAEDQEISLAAPTGTDGGGEGESTEGESTEGESTEGESTDGDSDGSTDGTTGGGTEGDTGGDAGTDGGTGEEPPDGSGDSQPAG